MSREYRAMWEKLDINMQSHDMLMELLPVVYDRIYLSQQERPRAMGFYDYVVSEIHGVRVKELVEHKERGGKVFGTFCVYVPEEIILAAGGIAVGLCAGTDYSVPIGEQILPRNLWILLSQAGSLELTHHKSSCA
ncbi:MAG: 2-hydroxyacyl-CoA dehydratase [Acidobacteriota bacterium]